VLKEFQYGVDLGRLPATDLTWLAVLELSSEEQDLFQEHLKQVNAGEAACLAVAAFRNGRFLTVDRDGRKLAAQVQIPIGGTLGILARLVKKGALTLEEANDLLDQMMAEGYRSPVSTLDIGSNLPTWP
jgi:predicted nucleic acid-binding protein